MAATTDELIRLLRVLIREALPELGKVPYCVKARVLKVRVQGGRYAADLQVLGKDGSPEPGMPVLPAVELPAYWVGPARGLVAWVRPGTVVRVGFYYNDPGMPYVDAVLPDGFDVPAPPEEGLLAQHSAGTALIVGPDGVIVRGNLTVEGEIKGGW